MTLRSAIGALAANEDLNFLLTNRIPRFWATQFMGWFSRIEQPLVRDASIALWKLFSDVDLSDARTTRFRSLHEAFTRELRDGARPVNADPGVLASPCDAIVGAGGRVENGIVYQAKGFPYRLEDLLIDPALVARHEGGQYLTLRLTAGMYHRFHAPQDLTVQRVTYVSGDTWNVNPIALKRVERLFCRNERVVVETTLNASGESLTLVPVAAILVASLRLTFLDAHLHLRYRGPNVLACHATLRRGQQMGWFEHGSTIIVFAPAGFSPHPGIVAGARVRMGEALMRNAGHDDARRDPTPALPISGSG
jgi:phosphatidylserine decarboxylase